MGRPTREKLDLDGRGHPTSLWWPTLAREGQDRSQPATKVLFPWTGTSLYPDMVKVQRGLLGFSSSPILYLHARGGGGCFLRE